MTCRAAFQTCLTTGINALVEWLCPAASRDEILLNCLNGIRKHLLRSQRLHRLTDSSGSETSECQWREWSYEVPLSAFRLPKSPAPRWAVIDERDVIAEPTTPVWQTVVIDASAAKDRTRCKAEIARYVQVNVDGAAKWTPSSKSNCSPGFPPS